MDLAPDAAWGAARIESWCALALLEKEGSVVVVRQQLAAHPDDIDVNVVDPRGGWTALLIAWCVAPRPPPNLPAFAPLSSNNHRLWSSCIFPRGYARVRPPHFSHLLPLPSAAFLRPVSPPPHCLPALHLLHHHSVATRPRLDLQSPLSSSPALSSALSPTVH